jgi:hypothetical protein
VKKKLRQPTATTEKTADEIKLSSSDGSTITIK